MDQFVTFCKQVYRKPSGFYFAVLIVFIYKRELLAMFSVNFSS